MVGYAVTSVPSYPCGQIGFVIGSVDLKKPHWNFTDTELDNMNVKYYSAENHRAAFDSIPRSIAKQLIAWTHLINKSIFRIIIIIIIHFWQCFVHLCKFFLSVVPSYLIGNAKVILLITWTDKDLFHMHSLYQYSRFQSQTQCIISIQSLIQFNHCRESKEATEFCARCWTIEMAMYEFFMVLGVCYLGFTAFILIAQHRAENRAYRAKLEAAAAEMDVVELQSVQNLTENLFYKITMYEVRRWLNLTSFQFCCSKKKFQ